jgi:hypothetical protein
VQILRPSPGVVRRRQLRRFGGRSAHASGPVELTLRRKRGKLCQSFDGRHFRRGPCRSGRTFFAGTLGKGRWAFRMPIDLPRGRYVLTATARAANGRLASQTVRFRANAPVRHTKPPPLVSEEEYEEGAHP